MDSEGLLQRRIEKTSERFLEDEALYSYLTDQENQLLVNWGLEQVERCLKATAGIADDEAAMGAAGPCLSEARDKMRRIGRLVSARSELSSADLARELDDLTGNQQVAEKLAREKDRVTDRQMVEAILQSLREHGRMTGR